MLSDLIRSIGELRAPTTGLINTVMNLILIIRKLHNMMIQLEITSNLHVVIDGRYKMSVQRYS